MNKKYHLSCEEFGLRLAKIREYRSISARQMSLDIGQNKNYINSIESGKNYPSMIHFFEICEYLKVTPKSFFDTDIKHSVQAEEFLSAIDGLSPQKYHHLYQLACDLSDIPSENNHSK